MMNNCKECKYYKMFYRKGYFSFWEERIGYCNKKLSVVKEENYCKNWKKSNAEFATLKTVKVTINNIKSLIEINEFGSDRRTR